VILTTISLTGELAFVGIDRLQFIFGDLKILILICIVTVGLLALVLAAVVFFITSENARERQKVWVATRVFIIGNALLQIYLLLKQLT